jgi:two-component sensor histidine kinase
MSRVQAVQPDDLLVTDRLFRRPARSASLERELSAFHELSLLMASSPSEAIQRFLDIALELCPSAGSAGLSELAEEEGQQLFRWTAMSGAFAHLVGGSTPRNFSPCGLCLDNHHTILVDHPARVFTYFKKADPQIVEGLIVPLYDTGKRAIGTLWVVSHDEQLRFDPTDARVMEQLAVQLVLAIKLRRKAVIAAKLEETARDNEILVQEVRHRVKNMIQMTSSLLQLQERGAASNDVREALREAQTRLMVLASVYEKLLQPNAEAREVDACELIEALVQALRDSSPQRAQIDLDVSCDTFKIGVAQAVPLGLIVNEAATNAFKHAFGAEHSGKLRVSLDRNGSECLLTISDNGKGIVGDARSGSLGMRLMKTLARQLKADLEIDGSDGTTVSLRWAMHPDEARESSVALVH